ncbi:MAG: cell division protein, partial [Burkholderiaceae bacterium]|nr:cell division protein [Burkholderiaceae bacterium]
MTDLQVNLIVIGAVIIIGVIAYNKWQEYRAHRAVERAFDEGSPEDVLMQDAMPEEEGARREPFYTPKVVTGFEAEYPVTDISVNGIGGDRDVVPYQDETEVVVTEAPAASAAADEDEADDVAGIQAIGEERREPSFGPEEPPPALPGEQVFRNSPVDDLIDYAILLNPEEPVRAEKLLPLIQSLRHTGNKPVHFAGLVQDAQTGESSWQPVLHGGIYHQLKAGVQLANRTGALSEIEYSELVSRLRQMADGIGAEPDVPDMAEMLKIARSLYRFVADHDARLGINVRTNGAPWAVKTLMAVLDRQKFSLRPDGVFVMHDADGGVLFSLM